MAELAIGGGVLVALVLAMVLDVTPAQARGFHNNFSDATKPMDVNLPFASSVGNNGATAEPGEPDFPTGPAQASVWQKIKILKRGTMWAEVCDRHTAAISGLAQMSLHTGKKVSKLKTLPRREEARQQCDKYGARFAFDVKKKGTYFIRFDAPGAETPLKGSFDFYMGGSVGLRYSAKYVDKFSAHRLDYKPKGRTRYGLQVPYAGTVRIQGGKYIETRTKKVRAGGYRRILIKPNKAGRAKLRQFGGYIATNFKFIYKTVGGQKRIKIRREIIYWDQ